MDFPKIAMQLSRVKMRVLLIMLSLADGFTRMDLVCAILEIVLAALWSMYELLILWFNY